MIFILPSSKNLKWVFLEKFNPTTYNRYWVVPKYNSGSDNTMQQKGLKMLNKTWVLNEDIPLQ